MLALQENINLFFSPSQVVTGEAPANTPFRLGGMVVDGSVRRNGETLEIQFDLTDTAETVTVAYTGILPDLFREGQGVVVEGKMNGPRFEASQLLVKHSEEYTVETEHKKPKEEYYKSILSQ